MEEVNIDRVAERYSGKVIKIQDKRTFLKNINNFVEGYLEAITERPGGIYKLVEKKSNVIEAGEGIIMDILEKYLKDEPERFSEEMHDFWNMHRMIEEK